MSSTSCSAEARAIALAAALAAALAGCGHRRSAPEAVAPRIAVLPPANLSARAAPLDDTWGIVEAELAGAGIALAPRDDVERFLSAHRLRNTDGVSQEIAAAAAHELGVDGILVTTLEQFSTGGPASFASTLRLVSATRDADVRWIDGRGRTGEDAPGILGRGVVTDVGRLRSEQLARLVRSLGDHLHRRGPTVGQCATRRTFRPRVGHRSPTFKASVPRSVAVLPFVNRTPRRGANDVVALQVFRQLADSRAFRPLEPGVVKDKLLALRVTYSDGVSLDTALMIAAALDVDLILTGEVFEYDDGGALPPRVSFSTLLLDARSRETLWRSSSTSAGDEGVFFFGAGSVSTASVLACGMARGVVQSLAPSR